MHRVYIAFAPRPPAPSFASAGAPHFCIAGAQALNLGLSDADDLATHFAKDKWHAEKFSRRRLAAHDKAVAVTSLLALGARFRSRPFRLAYGLTASFLSLIPPLCGKRCPALIKP